MRLRIPRLKGEFQLERWGTMADLYETTPKEYLYSGTSWHAWANDAGRGIMADPLICLRIGCVSLE